MTAAQTLLFKTAACVGAFIYYVTIYAGSDPLKGPWGEFWKICFVPLVVCLYGSQLYACKILYELENRCENAVSDAKKPPAQRDSMVLNGYRYLYENSSTETTHSETLVLSLCTGEGTEHNS